MRCSMNPLRLSVIAYRFASAKLFVVDFKRCNSVEFWHLVSLLANIGVADMIFLGWKFREIDCIWSWTNKCDATVLQWNSRCPHVSLLVLNTCYILNNISSNHNHTNLGQDCRKVRCRLWPFCLYWQITAAPLDTTWLDIGGWGKLPSGRGCLRITNLPSVLKVKVKIKNVFISANKTNV